MYMCTPVSVYVCIKLGAQKCIQLALVRYVFSQQSLNALYIFKFMEGLFLFLEEIT